jgi:capsular polysaccharide biosynthesis protein
VKVKSVIYLLKAIKAVSYLLIFIIYKSQNYNLRKREELKTVEQDVEIDLKELFKYLLSHVVVIAAASIICAIAAFCYSSFYIEPEYESSAGIFIVSTSNSLLSYSDLQISSSLTEDYAEIAQTRTVAEEVIEMTGVDMDYEDVQNLLTVTNPTDTKILYFTIRYTDPEIAMKLANAYAEVLKTKIGEIMNVDEPTIFESAIVNNDKVAPSNAKYTLIGFAIGLIISCGIFVVSFLLDDTVTCAEDIEKYFDMKTLAPIPADPEEIKAAKLSKKKKKA